MKFKVLSSKFEDGEFILDAPFVRTSNFELRSPRQRRASVLVLVMTILGILFVLGVAFLATMNFEADMIVSESQRDRAESRVTAVVDQLGSTLRDGLMSDSRIPFGNTSAALSATAYAEMPGVQNSFSSVEPHWHPGPNGILGGTGGADDLLVFSTYTDVEGLRQRPYVGPSLPQGFAIDTSLPNGDMMATLPDGTNLKKCLGGINIGNVCDFDVDCPGSACEGPRVLDADGDGIVDSVMVYASLLDFSDAQLAALSARLNPASNPTGKVFVGMRVLPHGGLVNLNASHPKLIEKVLDVPNEIDNARLGLPPDPEYKFYHRPTRNQASYSPLLEEPMLRRRVFLPPRTLPPSWLHGDPFSLLPNAGADMPWQLFAPLPINPAAADRCDPDPYAAVFDRCYRYRSMVPDERFNPPDPDSPRLWAVRMEPFTADWADGSTDGIMPEYDRRHLVTTVGHDDLLTRGGRVPNPAVPGGEEDILAKMTQANQTAWDPDIDCPPLLPFEYVEYPATIPSDCCSADLACKLNARKGRLQLSLPFLDDQIDAAKKLPDPKPRQEAFDRIFRLIHDTFFLLVRNAARVTTLEGTPCTSNTDCPFANGACGTNNVCIVSTNPAFTKCASVADCGIPGSVCRADGVCTIQAPYWQDVPCAATPTVCNIAAGEVCNPVLDRCVDAWTGQTHSQSLISRTAASLTANFIDYADLECSGGLRDTELCTVDADCPGGVCADRGIPTRVAVRSLDFTRGMCVKGANTGRACDDDAYCGGGAKSCTPPAKAAGKPFDFDPDPNVTKFEYVYGLERQPYITEVATLVELVGTVPVLTGWAVELFNPHDAPINTTDQYFLYWINPGGGSSPQIVLNATLQPNGGTTPNPFMVFITANNAAAREALLGTPFAGVSHDLTGSNALSFTNGSTIYLVRRVRYPMDTSDTDIVVDQFEIPDAGKVASVAITDPCLGAGGCVFSRQRVLHAPSPWTATVPKTVEIGPGPTSLGTWNDALDDNLHPVEVNFADLGSFSRPFDFPGDPKHGSVSFPTTGSLLMLMRHANRAFSDRTAPDLTEVRELAFTARLIGATTIKDPVGGGLLATIPAEQQIDNGRMPVFDESAHSPPPPGGDGNWYASHHLSPSVTQLGAPGNLDTLPWGQLVFDYFTALPLSNPGPYFGPDKDKVAMPDSLPRVDLDGLRVHGRININAAPWKVLAGLPFVPMQKIPVAFKPKLRKTLGFVESTAVDPLNPTLAELIVKDDEAAPIGEALAQTIVAYRDLRPIGGTGNFDDGTPPVTPPAGTPVYYARGWNPMLAGTPPTSIPPMARRGTGFMSVGELANVRHIGITDPLYRIDSGVLDMDPADNNTENFVDAVAGLVALGDWVTVRSQVFTVYGVLRGEEDSTIIDPNPATPPTQAELRARDADSRAMRFQETIDRLPTFLGEPVPSRIGDRTLTRYTDVRND